MKIMIVEDQDPTRERLIALLDGQNGFKVTSAVDCAEKALECLNTMVPDIIILDLGLPGLSGVDAIRAVTSSCPSARILVFTISDEDEKVFASLKAGASGYILKDAKSLEIISAIEELKEGGAPMSFPIAKKVLNEFQQMFGKTELKEVLSPLSSREKEILILLYEGDSYKEIGEKLFISAHTVHTHIKNIYQKLHVNSRGQAIFEAYKKKIITIPNSGD